ncbi:hypothetical protein C8R45DRAFT_559463 [Mycena sanguinolenta]|nr:hypothetical protein C8R45DRAFT_559463 [Mycena sanguinolenta]
MRRIVRGARVSVVGLSLQHAHPPRSLALPASGRKAREAAREKGHHAVNLLAVAKVRISLLPSFLRYPSLHPLMFVPPIRLPFLHFVFGLFYLLVCLSFRLANCFRPVSPRMTRRMRLRFSFLPSFFSSYFLLLLFLLRAMLQKAQSRFINRFGILRIWVLGTAHVWDMRGARHAALPASVPAVPTVGHARARIPRRCVTARMRILDLDFRIRGVECGVRRAGTGDSRVGSRDPPRVYRGVLRSSHVAAVVVIRVQSILGTLSTFSDFAIRNPVRCVVAGDFCFDSFPQLGPVRLCGWTKGFRFVTKISIRQAGFQPTSNGQLRSLDISFTVSSCCAWREIRRWCCALSAWHRCCGGGSGASC